MDIRYEIRITDPNDRRDRLDQPLRALKRRTFGELSSMILKTTHKPALIFNSRL